MVHVGQSPQSSLVQTSSSVAVARVVVAMPHEATCNNRRGFVAHERRRSTSLRSESAVPKLTSVTLSSICTSEITLGSQGETERENTQQVV